MYFLRAIATVGIVAAAPVLLYVRRTRTSTAHEGYFSLAAHPLYVGIALVCLAGGALVCVLCAERQRDACLALLMLLGLWLYPSTDTHYCVVLSSRWVWFGAIKGNSDYRRRPCWGTSSRNTSCSTCATGHPRRAC